MARHKQRQRQEVALTMTVDTSEPLDPLLRALLRCEQALAGFGVALAQAFLTDDPERLEPDGVIEAEYRRL